jgi:hypothetical protein
MQVLEHSVAERIPRISVKVSYYSPLLEEIPLTFQVGMKAKDGVVIASDTRITRVEGVRTHFNSTKFDVFNAENLAFCSSGDNFCMAFQKVVREQMNKLGFAGKGIGHMKQELTNCILTARQDETNYRESRKDTLERIPRESQGGNTLIVLREPKEIQLWSVDTTRGEQCPNPLPIIDGCIPVGDVANSAVFFLTRYFGKLNSTVSDMIPLAVHTVLMAGCEFVDGLEVGVFSQKEFRVLTSDELKEAVEASQTIDGYVLNSFRKAAQP